MKFPLLAAFALALCALAHAQDAALEEARKLFPEFSKSVYSDRSKARDSFDELITLGPSVQQRLLSWLDEQYEDKKANYFKQKSGKNLGSSRISLSDQREIDALRKQLESIRSIKDENEMKKVLQKDGWSALKKLLSLNRSNIRSLDDLNDSIPDPAKAKAALEEAEIVGKFRYELRKKLGKDVDTVDEDIRKSSKASGSSDQAASIAMNRKAASVLAQNEKVKGDIPSKEYKGILELNHWRIAAGMQPLLMDPKLCDAARDHCKDMERLKFFAHDSPVKGKTKPWDRAKNFGTTARAENIAINDSTEASNMAWFYSPGHHKNMFKPDYSVIGLGIQGRHYCQLFR